MAGLGVNVLLMPVYAFLGMRFGRIHAAKMQAHDERVKVSSGGVRCMKSVARHNTGGGLQIMSEIIQGIKIIKVGSIATS